MSARINPHRPSIRLSPVHSRQNSAASDRPGAVYQQLDPLLSNLSPESTLQALTSTDAVSDEKAAHDILSQSISQVSPAERALGIRAAVAAQNLDLWHKEVQSWAWPNANDAKVGKGFIPPPGSSSGSSPSRSGSLFPPGSDGTYYGSLTSSVVEWSEKRIEEIRDGMEDLRVEELKEHVLNAHIPSRSRPSSATSSVSVPPPLSYVQLSDFTAVITATILRALPHLSRLNALLLTWDVRLLVLRQIPGLLRELSITRSAIDAALDALRNTQPDLQRYSDESLAADHVKLESAVVVVGRRMDRVLDALEGRPDSLPEQWIDDLESIESDFAAWVVEAEKYKVHNEWLRSKLESQAETPVDHSVQPQTSLENPLDDQTLAPAPAPPEVKIPETDLSVQETVQAPDHSSTEPEQVNLAHNEPLVSRDADAHPHLTVSISSPELPATAKRDDLIPVLVAEDSETPTQSDFPPDVSSMNGKPSNLASCTVQSDLDNKENIPPLGFEQLDGSNSPITNTPTRPQPLSENSGASVNSSVDHSVLNEEVTLSYSTVANDVPASQATGESQLPQQIPSNVIPEAQTPSQVAPRSQPVEITPEPTSHGEDPKMTKDSGVDIGAETPAPANISPLTTPKTSDSRLPKIRPAFRGSQIPLASPKSGSTHTPIKSVSRAEEKFENVPKTLRKPLQSPIKLAETRCVKAGLEKGSSTPRKISHRRRTSTGSVGSLLSDHSSLISSPDVPEPRTASSNETQADNSSRSKPIRPPPHGIQPLREDRLRRFEDRKPDSMVIFPQTRAVSLPLERFINERLELGLSGESGPAVKHSNSRPITSSDFPKPPRSQASSPAQSVSRPISSVPRPSGRRHTLSRGKSSSGLNVQNETARNAEQHRNAFAQNTARRALEHQAEPKSMRLRKQLTAHPSLESLGMKRQELSYVDEHSSELTNFESRASSPARHHRQPRDHLDEKISSILNSLPGHIHLVDSHHEADTSSSSSSMDRRVRHRSESPCGPPTRSTTPAPSLTLMPAGRRRLSHAYKAEDSCVKLYHLHNGGQSAPTKLFVRTVGEEGQRVMVRVGGGWADLGEYLREYVIHHGRRKVSETPRVEVQGIKTRLSPSYTSPGALLTPATSYLTSGRATPSRPPSSLSARPPSSLTVHKKRRGSTASDIMGTRAVTTGHINSFTSPPPPVPPSPHFYRPTSLHVFQLLRWGLPLSQHRQRARFESMSPEGEAWVEDVLNKTRRSSSHHPPHFTLGSPPFIDIDDRSDVDRSTHSLPKVRSIGDIGSIGTSRRVVLRGLGNRRS
ncbi:uncharacterized protein N7506_007189 [Penicillium brevicompactum]|uniref:uncharacterized protein n=1 Tax=Penicillium brevicompactum TaxID=5074 RepID=UPI0025408FCB|nr:uncharacterized protein N7506_007189 [Penicillium brevicompactum]KAJ5333406.1 hypothetical protein N7506_007189 [Penicillium brevicompactum]